MQLASSFTAHNTPLQLAKDFNIAHDEEILRTELANMVNIYIQAHEAELIGNEKYKRLFGGRRGGRAQ